MAAFQDVLDMQFLINDHWPVRPDQIEDNDAAQECVNKGWSEFNEDGAYVPTNLAPGTVNENPTPL